MDIEKLIKGIQECDLNGGLIGNCPYKDAVVILKERLDTAFVDKLIKQEKELIKLLVWLKKGSVDNE